MNHSCDLTKKYEHDSLLSGGIWSQQSEMTGFLPVILFTYMSYRDKN